MYDYSKLNDDECPSWDDESEEFVGEYFYDNVKTEFMDLIEQYVKDCESYYETEGDDEIY